MIQIDHFLMHWNEASLLDLFGKQGSGLGDCWSQPNPVEGCQPASVVSRRRRKSVDVSRLLGEEKVSKTRVFRSRSLGLLLLHLNDLPVNKPG